MASEYFKPSDKVIRYAMKIARYAHMPWVTLFFFLAFLLDSFLMFIPADGLLSVTVLFAPDKKRTWYLASLAGSLLGYVIFYFLTISSFQHLVLDFVTRMDYAQVFNEIVSRARHFGLLYLAVAVFVMIPPVFGMVAGIVIGLNPWSVFIMLCVLKAVRIYFLIFIVKKLWSAMILLRQKVLQHKHEKELLHADAEEK